MAKPRVLHCISVYNGRAFVRNAVDSAMTMSQERADVDVLVMDDASPDPGWSAELRGHCASVGALYYLTPRNLGIPRNVSLGLRVAVEQGYDYVTINNSDVIFPHNLIDGMVLAITSNENVGSVTALSNNVSIYSVPNRAPDRLLSDPAAVDFVSSVADAAFGGSVLDIPAGISFAIMIPTAVIQAVGVMDPVFGRGYCEESDWCLRSLKAGLRICLAPGVFVYHQGGGSNVAAGLVASGHTSVPENEAIIDMRHPEFRAQCQRFMESGGSSWYSEKLIHDLIDSASIRNGMTVEIDGSSADRTVSSPVRVCLRPDGDHVDMEFSHLGFRQCYQLSEAEAVDYLQQRFSLVRITLEMAALSPLARQFSEIYETRQNPTYAGYPATV